MCNKICTWFCCILFSCECIYVMYLFTFFQFAALEQGQSYACPSATEPVLKDIGKELCRNQTKTANCKQYIELILDGSLILLTLHMLNLKQIGQFFWIVFHFCIIGYSKYNDCLWNWLYAMLIWSALWVLIIWCLSTRASAATVLSMYPRISRFVWVKSTEIVYLPQIEG